MTAVVRAALLTDYPALALAYAQDPLAQLRAVGLEPGVTSNPSLFISARRVAQLLENTAAASGRQDFGVQLAMHRKISHLGVSSLVISQQRTVRNALAMVERYRHLMNETLLIHVEEEDELAHIRCELTLPSGGAKQATELAAASTIQVFRLIAGEHWHPQSVHFLHAAPANTSTHRRFFNCPVRFGDHFNGLICPSQDLDRINPAAQPGLAEQARILLDALPTRNNTDLLERLKNTLVQLIPHGRANIRSSAATLGTSVRTLQRLLDAHGVTFSEVLATVRKSLAEQYLTQPELTVLRISELLGYSAPPAFVRWFNGSFGTTPQQWRRAAITAQAELPPRGFTAHY
jgi:AraC-like DNA-binding protein